MLRDLPCCASYVWMEHEDFAAVCPLHVMAVAGTGEEQDDSFFAFCCLPYEWALGGGSHGGWRGVSG